MASKIRILIIQITLFILTFVATTLAGTEWASGKSIFFGDIKPNTNDYKQGLLFSSCLIGILLVHELGHYFAARFYKAKVTLPYFIPMWLGFLPIFAPSIGTMGAFIRIKSPLLTRRQTFDVGVAGPLAGFVAALIVLFIGFYTLPPLDYLFAIHPEYAQYGTNYPQFIEQSKTPIFSLGPNFLFEILKAVLPANPQWVPTYTELYHYPLLFAGYLALFFTALNLMPIGQLDGGHLVFGLFGNKIHNTIARIAFVGFIFFAGLGNLLPFDFSANSDLLTEILFNNGLHLGFLFIAFSRFSSNRNLNFAIPFVMFALHYGFTMFFPQIVGYGGWLLFCVLLGRVLGISHPPVLISEPLNPTRKIIGYITLLIFLLCFTPYPFNFSI